MWATSTRYPTRPARPRHRPGRSPVTVALVAAAMLGALLTGCGSSSLPLAGGGATPTTGSGPAPVTTPTTAQRVTTGATLHWSACSAAAGPAGLQCATLQVPLDYADPAKGTIGIALDRKPASGHAVGSLLTNPGGPGVSGVDYLPDLLTLLPASITSRFDVVGFDPRGVGRSDPVTCGTGPELDAELSVDPAPTTTAGFAALLAADKRFAAGCEARSRRILPYVSTVDAARDLDRIRAALGDKGLDYLGFSYGTLLGATYARLFPTRIRAMVLDGALDPALGSVATVQAQSASLDAELDDFFASCRTSGCGWTTGPDPTATFDALLARVRAHPVTVSGSTQTVGAAAFLYGTASALYSPQSWPALGRALTQLSSGDGTAMLAMFDSYIGRNADGTYANTIEAETAVDCLDAPVPSVAGLRRAAAATSRLAPVFGVLDLYSDLTCAVWPTPVTGHPAPVAAPGSPPIVVVGSTGDPVTPYAWARDLAGQLDRGVLLTRTGDGHTGYAFSSCIRTDVDRYLLTLVPPRPGTTCPSD